MKETQDNSNLVEVLEGMLQGSGLVLHQRKLVDGRIKAHFVTESPSGEGKSHLVEIIEDEICHYKETGADSKMLMRQRGRLA